MEPLEEAVPERLAQAEIDTAVAVARRVTENIRRAVEVKDEVLEHVTVSLLAEGHILVEDYPGVGKTALARALSRSIDCAFARVQCTADLLPADIVGSQIYNQREARFEFRPGPIFANVVIVDEVNRASPKTQSGLLECMQERHVTVDATSHELARPFLVFATQNPVEYEGTYPLPEAQVDRFMVRLSLGYPDADAEAGMLLGHESRDKVLELEPVADRAEIVEAVETAHRVHASRALRDYIVALLRRTREDDRVELGASPRAGLMLLRAAKARALVHGRDHALPDDVQALADAVLSHRLMLAPEAAGVRRAEIVARRDRVRPGAVRRALMRSALGCAALGLLLLVVAGTFDAEPLYVTGAALLLLGAGARAWIGLGGVGAKLAREISVRSVIEDQPLQVKLSAKAGRIPLPPGWIDEPLLPEPVRLPAGRRQARVRIEVTFGRRGRRRLPPPALVLRDPFGLAQRVIAGPVDGRDPRAAEALPGQPDRGRGRRDPGARPRLAAGRRRDRDRRPAPVARGLARLAHPLAVVRARRRADGAQADLRGRLAPAGRDRPARARPRPRRSTRRSAPPARSPCYFARKTGCSLLMPGDRRASVIEHDLLAWPALHVRMALMDDRAGPSLAAAQNRRGLVIYVAARPVDRAPRGLGRTPGGCLIVVPGEIGGRRAILEVAGCYGYAAGRHSGAAAVAALEGAA